MDNKIEKVIAYKARDGKLFYTPSEALEYNGKLWEERLDKFLHRTYKADDIGVYNPIMLHMHLMEYFIKNRRALLDILKSYDN